MNRHRATLMLFIASLLLSLLLLLTPLPDSVAPLKPYWPILVLTFWTLETPGRVTLGLAFAVGLGADLLDGILLGEQALRLTVAVFLVARFRPRLRFFPMWQQVLAVLALLLNDRILHLAMRLFAGGSWPPAMFWTAPIVGAALWPFVFLLLDDLHTRLRARES